MANTPKKNEHLFFNALPDFEKEAEAEIRRRNAPKSPTFSLEDMDEARKSAFAKGREEGLQIAKDAIEQRTELLIHSLVDRVQDLEREQDMRHAESINNAITIAYKAIEKLIPTLLDRHKTDLILHALSDFFTTHINKNTLTLWVHPSNEQPVAKHINNLSSTILIETDDTMTDSQVRMEWTNGSFEFKPDTMMNKILDIIAGHLTDGSGGLDVSPKNPHNNDETDDNT
jgi:flagellar biosynthesis/type III secretory pathway protein FliH